MPTIIERSSQRGQPGIIATVQRDTFGRRMVYMRGR